MLGSIELGWARIDYWLAVVAYAKNKRVWRSWIDVVDV